MREGPCSAEVKNTPTKQAGKQGGRSGAGVHKGVKGIEGFLIETHRDKTAELRDETTDRPTNQKCWFGLDNVVE